MDRDEQARRRQLDWRRTEDKIRRLVRDGRFIVRSHAFEKLEENNWTVDDLVESLLNGAIVGAESDSQSIDGKKYKILGSGFGCVIESVGKIVGDDDERQYFVITCY